MDDIEDISFKSTVCKAFKMNEIGNTAGEVSGNPFWV